MGKKNKNLPFMCGCCKQFFVKKQAVHDHAISQHKGHLVSIYEKVSQIDMRDNQPSFADRAVEAEIARNCGLPTDDLWLLGE
jgi:hypothetical protein